MSSNVSSGTEGAVGQTTAGEGAAAQAPAGGEAEQSRRLLEDSFNEGTFDLIDQLVAPDAINHDPAQPARLRELRGPEVLKQTVQIYRNAFPDLRMTVDDVIAAGDKVALRWHSEGTHRGELEGLAPTGARVSVTGVSIDRWQDGKIVEAWNEWDNLGLGRQLGAAPPEGSPVEKVGVAVQRLMAARMRKKNP